MKNSALPQLRTSLLKSYSVPLVKIKWCKCSAPDNHDIWIISFTLHQSKIDSIMHDTKVRDVPDLCTEIEGVLVCTGPQENGGYHFFRQHWTR